MPKHQVNDYIIVKKQSAKVSSQPFEHTFRLQVIRQSAIAIPHFFKLKFCSKVHLPRNQLYVMRVGPKTLLQDILQEVCQEKNLDISKYEIRHPGKPELKFRIPPAIVCLPPTVCLQNYALSTSLSIIFPLKNIVLCMEP